jgi:hypothetical protein
MTIFSKVTFVGAVRVSEHRYESGLIEVGLYVAEVLPGAGPILSAVVTRREPGASWRVQGRGFGADMSYPSRKRAMARALELAANHEASLAHLR